MTVIKPTGRRKSSAYPLSLQVSLFFLLVHSQPLFPPFTLSLENGPLKASISYTVLFTPVSSLRTVVLCSESQSKSFLLIYKCYFYMFDLLFYHEDGGIWFFWTLVMSYQIIKHHIPEDIDLHNYHCIWRLVLLYLFFSSHSTTFI